MQKALPCSGRPAWPPERMLKEDIIDGTESSRNI